MDYQQHKKLSKIVEMATANMKSHREKVNASRLLWNNDNSDQKSDESNPRHPLSQRKNSMSKDSHTNTIFKQAGTQIIQILSLIKTPLKMKYTDS